MKSLRQTALALIVIAWFGACAAAGDAGAVKAVPKGTLTAFASERELADLLARWAGDARKRQTDQARRLAGSSMELAQSAPPSAPAPAASAKDSAASESVTNVQHEGVDEGGIVKAHGDHLVILRRGRLFTVRIGDHELRPISFTDAFGPDVDPRGAWYDELLISGNTIAVIGYSYARGGTEIGVFEIANDGSLAHRASYHLRSHDYYSSRNYASRLIGSRLIFYSPHFLNIWGGDPYASFPAMRKWRAGATPAEFRRIAPASRIYRTDEPLDPFAGVALHSVTVCDLAQVEMECESTAVLGPPGRVFYVSPTAVFVWTTAWRRGPPGTLPASAVFQIPLDGSAPSALKVAGAPIDQLSFLEDDDGMLNVLVRSSGRGDGMWAAEVNTGDLALLRVPLSSFSDGRESAPKAAYAPLPRPTEGSALQNRYVGRHLLYGAGTGWGRAPALTQSQVYAVAYAGERRAHRLPLTHHVDRIEALGTNVVVVGSDGKDLHFTTVRLGRTPLTVGHYSREDAAQGETRTHGFFYKPESDVDGVLGLPIVSGNPAGARQLRRESAAVLFLRNRGLSLAEIGTLDTRPGGQDDGCRASCVDWYGNSRPLFLRGRVFALMGYEIVEGRIEGERITETRRISFAPPRVKS